MLKNKKRSIQATNAKTVAWELNDRLVGAYWEYLLEGKGRCSAARTGLLDRFRELAAEEIPATAFESIRVWKEYLREKPSNAALPYFVTNCGFPASN